MQHHRYKIGQTVTAHTPGVPPGPYVITRLLPLVGKEPHYRVKDENGGERALLESELREGLEGSWIEGRVIPKRSQRGR